MAYVKKCNGCGQELGEFEGQLLTSSLGGYDNYCDKCYHEVTNNDILEIDKEIQ